MQEETGTRRPVGTSGSKTRKADQGHDGGTPQASPAWITTYDLRWLEHLTKKPGRHSPA